MNVCVRRGGHAVDYCHHCQDPLCDACIEEGCCSLIPAESGYYQQQLSEDEQREGAEVSVTARGA